MFTSIDDFLTEYEYERSATEKLFAALTDECMNVGVCDGHRTVGRIAWHIVVTIPEMMGLTGLKFTTVGEHDPVPAGVNEISRAYSAVSAELVERIKAEWTDETLQIEDNMYDMQWKRGYTLEALIRHEAHHRGQLTVLMRQAGITVPGVYGPSKEEWAEFGAPTPAV